MQKANIVKKEFKCRRGIRALNLWDCNSQGRVNILSKDPMRQTLGMFEVWSSVPN